MAQQDKLAQMQGVPLVAVTLGCGSGFSPIPPRNYGRPRHRSGTSAALARAGGTLAKVLKGPQAASAVGSLLQRQLNDCQRAQFGRKASRCKLVDAPVRLDDH